VAITSSEIYFLDDKATEAQIREAIKHPPDRSEPPRPYRAGTTAAISGSMGSGSAWARNLVESGQDVVDGDLDIWKLDDLDPAATPDEHRSTVAG